MNEPPIQANANEKIAQKDCRKVKWVEQMSHHDSFITKL